MPIQNSTADDADSAAYGEAAMFAALAGILRRGEFVIEDVEALAAVVSNTTVEAGSRDLARRSLQWLARQSALRQPLSIWRKNDQARD